MAESSSTQERLALGIDVSEIMKMRLLAGSQGAADEADFWRSAIRSNFLAGQFTQRDAMGTRIALESGSGRERYVDTPGVAK